MTATPKAVPEIKFEDITALPKRLYRVRKGLGLPQSRVAKNRKKLQSAPHRISRRTEVYLCFQAFLHETNRNPAVSFIRIATLGFAKKGEPPVGAGVRACCSNPRRRVERGTCIVHVHVLFTWLRETCSRGGSSFRGGDEREAEREEVDHPEW
jgi:hypothetical protein